MSDKPKLSDILAGNGAYFNDWHAVKPADDFAPLPRGKYVARIIDGKLGEANTGTAGYKLTFEVCEGTYTGRRLWHDIWFGANNKSYVRRDLENLGITDPERQLREPLIPGIVCELVVVLETDDSGAQRNRVRSFHVVRIEEPESEPFAPSEKESDD